MTLFQPKKITDPRTGKERIVSPEEQKLMLEKGILFDVPAEPLDQKKGTADLDSSVNSHD